MLEPCPTLLFVNTAGRMSGGEFSMLEVAVAIHRRGVCRVRAAIPEGPFHHRLAQTGIACDTIPEWRPHRFSSPWAFLRSINTLRHSLARLRQLHAQSPNIRIHANAMPAAILAAGLGRTGPTRVWHCRDVSFPPRPLLEWIVRRCDRTIAISSTVRERLLHALPDALHPRIILIRNGIALERFRNLPSRAFARQSLGLPAEIPLIGMIAQKVPWKRHDLFLEAMACVRTRIPDADAVLAGTDLFHEHPARRIRLNRLGRQRGLGSHLHDMGEVQDIPLLLRAIDVLAHPPENEPFGRVICEAMAAGCPVVAVNAAGAAEQIENGKTGLLCPPNQAQAMADGICMVLEDAELRHRLRTHARIHVRDHFDMENTANQIVSLYLHDLSAPK